MTEEDMRRLTETKAIGSRRRIVESIEATDLVTERLKMK
jgi:hypothetical protein